MTIFFWYICSIKSPQCSGKYSNFFTIAIFLFRVLIWQKQQISLSVGYKTAKLKQETGNDCDIISGLQASRKTNFSDIFLFSYNQRTIIAHNKKMTKKSVFREAWSPEMASQSFPVYSFWSRGFVPHRKWNLASKHGKGKSLWKFFLCYTYQYIKEI